MVIEITIVEFGTQRFEVGWHGFDPYKFDFGEWVIRTNFVQESLEDFVEVLVELEDGLGSDSICSCRTRFERYL